MMRFKHRAKSGATSFYVVAISTLILAILATSFATAIMAEIIRSANDEIAQSAYDSALAGVEEAKLAYENYRNCVSLGYADKGQAPDNDGETTCAEIVYWMENADCDSVSRILGRIGESDEGREIKLEDTIAADGTISGGNLDQAYTCVKIDANPNDTYGLLSSNNPYKVITIGSERAADITSVTLSWHPNGANAKTPSYSSISNNNNGITSKVVFNPITRNSIIPTPSVLAFQIIQTPKEFSFDQLLQESYKTGSGQSAKSHVNQATAYFVPTDDLSIAAVTGGTNYIGIYNSSQGINNLTAAQLASNRNNQKNYPYVVYCDTTNASNFACSVKIDLPSPASSNENATRSNNLNFIISSPYGGQDTDFSLSYNCGDTDCNLNNSADGGSFSSSRQIVIDATGRAGDMYKRVEVRMEVVPTNQTVTSYPFFAIQADSIVKDIAVNTEYGVEDIPESPDRTITYLRNYNQNDTMAIVEHPYKDEEISIRSLPEEWEKANYVFNDWKGDDGKIYKPNDIYKVTSNLTLRAQWQKECTITYDINGGTGNAPDPVAGVLTGTSIKLAAADGFSKDGYRFAGWALNSPSGTVYSAGANYTVESDATFYAVWEIDVPAGLKKCQDAGVPLMQNWNGASTLNMEQSTSLCDMRDGQIYTVAKLKDGKVWMTKNLNLTGGTVLSSEDTDFESSYALPTTYGWSVSGDKLILPTSAQSFYYNNYAYVYNSDNITTSQSDCTSSQPCNSYYSWDAATLGSGRDISTDNTNAPYSICPKGWRLPTSGGTSVANWQAVSDFYMLAHQYGLDSTTTTYENDDGFYNQAGPGTTPNFLLTGLYNNGTYYNIGPRGYYWSATVLSHDASAYNLNFHASNINSAYENTNNLGFPVRCINIASAASVYQIFFYGNGGQTSGGDTWSVQITQRDVATTLNANPFTRSGYTFMGWATSEDGPVVYSDGASVTNIGTADNPAKLYAVWEDDAVIACANVTITFKTNNAESITINGITKTNNQTMNISCGTYNITGTFANGYKFSSWSATAGSFANSSTLSTTYTVTGSATITLNGAEDTYQIIFYGNGGQDSNGATDTVQVAQRNVVTTLTANPFTRDGYTFKGWATSEDGPVVYSDGASVTNIGTFEAPAELYAVWESNAPPEQEKCPGTDIVVMQNWNGASALSTKQSTSLCDIRDNQIYTVAKLDDGNVWMTQNLRLDLAAVTIGINNTNNPALEFINAVNNRKFGRWQCSSSKVYVCATEHDKPIFSMSSNSNYGAYYNYYTATAGTQPYGYTYSGSLGDICPTGWRLPRINEWNNFIEMVYIKQKWSTGIDYGATLQKLLAAPYNYVLAGYYFNFPPGQVPLVSVGSVGFYWTSGSYSDTLAYSYELWSSSASTTIVTTSGNAYDHRDIYNGLALRCIRDSSLVSDKYQINFHGNGGKDSNGATNTVQVAQRNVVTTLTANPFTRDGYTFKGWATSEDGPVVYSDGASVTNLGTFEAPAELYAVWEKQVTYTVNYNLNGGTGTTPVSQTVTSGTTITLPSSSGFSRTNYSFDGWLENNPSFATVYNPGSNYTVISNVTFYAKWKQDSVTPPPSTSCPAGFSEWTTGLCWRNIDQTGLFNQSGARSSCSSSGWRLPTVNEYRTLVNKYCDSAYAGNGWYCTGDTVTSKGFGYNGARIKESATKCTVEKSECEKYNEQLLSGCNTWIQQMKQCDILPDSSMVSQCKKPFQNGYNQCISNVEQRNCSAVYNQCMSNLSDTMIYQEDGKSKGGYWAYEDSGVMVMQQDGSDSTVVVGIDAWHILTNTSDSYISTRCVVNK